MSSLKEIFSPGGPLAQSISGYRVREQQVDMAERIAAAINSCSVFIAEAGTGTGKTFAYLVPALKSGGKVLGTVKHPLNSTRICRWCATP